MTAMQATFAAADLLASLGYAATFYIPARNEERAVIGAAGIQRLIEGFEVGAHTYNHRALTGLGHGMAMREILDGKAWLEDASSLPVKSFCYPRGKFNHQVRELVVQAGFTGARTTMGNIVTYPTDVFLCGTTSQVFSHRRLIHTRHAIIEQNWRGALNYARIFRLSTDWRDHFERGVAYVCEHGGVAHLWFHSWELDESDEWGRLEQLLGRLKARHQFHCVTNGELFARPLGSTPA